MLHEGVEVARLAKSVGPRVVLATGELDPVLEDPRSRPNGLAAFIWPAKNAGSTSNR